jgi:putative transposase
MPDHVHWFMAPARGAVALSMAVAKWKEWTSKRLLVATRQEKPLWQPGFFDHVLRSTESRSLKWAYVRDNPVRAGLVTSPEQWPYFGAIDFE